jgi:CheY-like chemotaxis protein
MAFFREVSALSHENACKKILVIDDEVIIREVVQGCLEELAGWQTICVGSAQEGLALLSETVPDLILLDVVMPTMDGLTFVERLQRHPTAPSIPIILLTVRVELTDRQRYQDLGLAGAIAKPFRPQQLVGDIAKIMGWVLTNPQDRKDRRG